MITYLPWLDVPTLRLDPLGIRLAAERVEAERAAIAAERNPAQHIPRRPR